MYHFIYNNKSYYKNLEDIEDVFSKIPPHMTKIIGPRKNLTYISHTDFPDHKNLLTHKNQEFKSSVDYNNISIPERYNTTFDVRWKWPNCMPPAVNQGSCGSCWAFASVHCLAARFFTCPDPEKCIKQGDLEDALNNILKVYKIQKTTLQYMFNILDANNDGKISKDDWMNAYQKYKKIITKVCVTPDCSAWDNPTVGLELSADFNIGYISGILTFMLNEPHVSGNDSHRDILPDTVIPLIMECGDNKSCSLHQGEGGIINLDDRALKVFKSWTVNNNDYISLSEWTDYYNARPLNLSVEEAVICCEPDCEEIDVIPKNKDIEYKNNPVCKGSTLSNAWTQLYANGVSSSYCINYNLMGYDNYDAPTCNELTGPGYGYCAGSLPASGWSKKNQDILIKASEKAEYQPATSNIALFWDGKKIDPPVEHTLKGGSKIMEWAAPTLFIFKANKPYKVEKTDKLTNEQVIMKEIYKNGPVTTGMIVYDDFENKFGGSDNKGGYKWEKGDDVNKLIYSHKSISTSPSSPPSLNFGGHAIIITGWGEYKDSKNKSHKYWTVLNSWGLDWGHYGAADEKDPYGLPATQTAKSKILCKKMSLPENCAAGGGYFWMSRGNNTCGIEENVYAATANIDNTNYSNKDSNKNPKIIDDPISRFQFERNPLAGGGTYFNPVGDPISMIPPSPYTFKWPTQKLRPIFEIGTVTENMTKKQNFMIINNKLNNILTQLLNYRSTQIDFNPIKGKNYINAVNNNGSKCNSKQPDDKCHYPSGKTAPIIMIEDELIQVFEKQSENKFKILRGIWSHKPSSHTENTKVYIFPYQQLNTGLLQKLSSPSSKTKPPLSSPSSKRNPPLSSSPSKTKPPLKPPPSKTKPPPPKPTSYIVLYIVSGIIGVLFIIGMIMWIRRPYNPNRKLLKRN